MSEVLSDKQYHKYVTNGYFLPISELQAVVELQRKIIHIHLDKGYKGSSLNTKGVCKTLLCMRAIPYIETLMPFFLPATNPRIAAVCKFLQNVNWQAAAPFFLGHQPFFLGSCYKISSSPWKTSDGYYSMSWKSREHKLKANRDSLQSVP